MTYHGVGMILYHETYSTPLLLPFVRLSLISKNGISRQAPKTRFGCLRTDRRLPPAIDTLRATLAELRAQLQAGFEEGLPSLSLPILVCMDKSL